MGFARRRFPPRRNQRYLCKHCRRSFSRQTFATTYWLKRPDLLPHILLAVVACSANRQIARSLGVAPATVDRQIARLGRHCLLLHAKLWRQTPPCGPLFFPMHFQIAVEAATGFFSYFTDTELRRKGRMTDDQKLRRADLERDLGRPPGDAVRNDVAELLQTTLVKARDAVVRSDDHRAYPRAMRSVACRIRHEITPGREHRDARNALFEVNLLDGWIRHSSSNHKRETIAWSKRRQAAAERLAILLVHRNYMRSRREQRRHGPSPGMLRGVVDKRLDVRDVLEKRLFPSRIALPPRWRLYYRREIRTRALPVNRTHDLKYAA